MFSIHDPYEILEGFLPDFSTGDIDDTLEGHRIHRIIDEADIGEDILDLLSLIELHSSIDAVGDVFSNQGFFYKTGLPIRAVEDSEV